MKTSLSHLPQEKQDELQKLVSIIRANCEDVEMVILYGSYARGDYRPHDEFIPEERSRRLASDYDILAVTSKKAVSLDVALWEKISDICSKFNFSAAPRILTHDVEALNIKLAEAQYFFTDVKKEGIMIYDSSKFQLAERRLITIKEEQRIMQDYFDEWLIKGAEQFFRMYEFCLDQNNIKHAAFCLHQTAEHAYKTVLLVFHKDCPRGHLLDQLGKDTEKIHDLMKNIFARIIEEDQDRFRLLEYAYIGGRYDPNYRIAIRDLKILAEQVQKLLQITRKICEEKICSFS